MSLLQRVAGASIWTAGGQQAMSVLAFVTSIVVARLLIPEELGDYAVAGAIVAITSSAASLQAGGYYTVTREPSVTLLNSGFSLELLTGFAAACLLWAGAALYGAIGGDWAFAQLLALSAVVLLLNPFGQMKTYWARDLHYARQTITLVLAGLLSMVVKVGLVIAGMGAIGLVIGELVFAAAFGAAMWFMLPVDRRFVLDRECVRRHLDFGVPAMITSGLSTINNRTPEIVLALVSGPAAVGVYFLAARIPEQVNQLGRSVSVSLLPAFSRAAPAQQERGYVLATRFSACLTGLPLALFIPFADTVIVGLFGDKWREGAVPLAMLTAAIMVRFTFSHVLTLLKARERMREITVQMAGNTAVTIAFVVAGALIGGLEGAAVGMLCAELAMVPWKHRLLRSMLAGPPIVAILLPPVLALAASAGAGALLDATLPEAAALPLAVLVSLAIFGLAIWRSERDGVETMVRTIVPRVRRRGRVAEAS